MLYPCMKEVQACIELSNGGHDDVVYKLINA